LFTAQIDRAASSSSPSPEVAGSHFRVRFGTAWASSRSTRRIIRATRLSVGPMFAWLNASGMVRSMNRQKRVRLRCSSSSSTPSTNGSRRLSRSPR
jgi:hypothetical protein